MKNVNQKYFALIIILICLLSPLMMSQTETISWIPLTKDAPTNIPGRNGPAPTFDEIGIPIYPGAYLTSVYQAVKSNELDSIEVPLPTIFFVTSDDQYKVEQFYKKCLNKSDGWNLFENYKTFVQGTISQAFSRTVPIVGIREETGNSYDLTGTEPKIKLSLKTRVAILYRP